MLEKGKPRKLVLYSKDRLIQMSKENKEKIEKYVKPEDTIQVDIESYVKMDMKRTEVILSISKVEVPENERNITHNTRVIDNSKPNNN